jgi:hypothetical protein
MSPPDELLPQGRGVVAVRTGGYPEVTWVTLAADSGGVVAARTRTQSSRTVTLAGLRTTLRRQIEVLADGLNTAEAIGRVWTEVYIGVPQGSMPEAARDFPWFYASGELSIPSDPSEITALSDGWLRELSRHAGNEAWEP